MAIDSSRYENSPLFYRIAYIGWGLFSSIMDALPIVSAFALILIAELGDKTQIITITLAAQSSPLLVLIGMVRLSRC